MLFPGNVFMLRIKHHEFWNTHLFHLPVYLYWLFLAVKARSLFFFSGANPGIETGGLIGESKYRILQKIDQEYLPVTLFFDGPQSLESTMEAIQTAALQFPFVVKPDIGQGGWLIDLIHDKRELQDFLRSIKMPFIVQEYIDDPIEVGLLYYRFPGESSGTISSLAMKQLLTVTGDGTSTIRELMKKIPRAKKQLARLESRKCMDLSRIPATGEVAVLSFVGNHSYGTTFHNFNHTSDKALLSVFDSLCTRIDGFYFGRFDLRCRSLEALKKGEFKILELNGVGSEPLHIFDPNEKLSDAWSSLFKHWDVIYRISKINRKNASSFMNLTEAIETYSKVRQLQRIHSCRFTIGN